MLRAMFGGAQGGALTQLGCEVGGWPLQIAFLPTFSVVLGANKILDQSTVKKFAAFLSEAQTQTE